MKKILLSLSFVMPVFSVLAQPIPFVGCPNVNVAVVRAGTNATNTNPYSIYNVNAITGTPTLLSGPILNPATAANLQINGVGLNTADGFLYGLNAEIPAVPLSLPIIPKIPFYKIGSNAQALQLGTIAGPAVITPENASVVSAAAGEIDQLDNYYFSAATGVVVPNFLNPTASTFSPSRLFIGTLANISGLPAGTAALAPTYVQVTNPSGDATGYLTSIYASITLSSAVNTGLRDFVFDHTDNLLATYVTYPDPANPGGSFYGQMLKVDPNTGILSAVAPAVILPFATASNEVAGTFIDISGNFLILFSNGDMYRANENTIGKFDGSISLLNANTGLPDPLRGDMASCGSSIEAGPLPVELKSFNVFKKDNTIAIQWQTASEINVEKFTLLKSIDGVNWKIISTVTANAANANGGQYQYIDNANNSTVLYRLATIDKNGKIVLSVIKKITANDLALSITSYPNPVTNTLIIESQFVFSTDTKVEILNFIGQLQNIPTKTIVSNTIKMNVSGLPNGAYFLRIYSKKREYTSRFIKQ
ncbi:MAG: T9SS type A sorting domain-containing protein [Bacteroidota bacterium]